MHLKIEMKSSQFVSQNWQQLRTLIVKSFENVDFNNNYNVDRVLAEVFSDITEKKASEYEHAFALREKEVVGAIFGIAVRKLPDQTSCSIGWFFTSYCLSQKEKMIVSDALINFVHHDIYKKGFRMIVTEIGTKQGERLLHKKYGYENRPVEEIVNRWIRIL